MKNKLDRSLSTLASVLCCTLGSGLVIVSCLGTETDNPVAGGDAFDGTSPENFFPSPGGALPCSPPDVEEEAMLPRWLATSVIVPSASGRVLATWSSSGGLGLFDASDPNDPVELSRGVVQGELRQLLLASTGELWVLATEPPVVERAELPTATALDPVLKLVRVDVSDPARPLRIAEATIEGEAWELREVNGDAWVLSARRTESERVCSSQENLCGFRSYEAMLWSGFRPAGGALEPIGRGEQPFERRGWWGTDGVVSDRNGFSFVLSPDGAGGLRSHILPPAGDGSVAGPVEVAGNELSVVRVGSAGARIDVYGLDAPSATLSRSLPLDARTERAGIHSLFNQGHLWLQAPYGETPPTGRVEARAQVWNLTGTTPAQLELPQPFETVLPIAGASREGQSGEILAIGFARDDSSGAEELTLLSITGGAVSVIDAPELDAQSVNLNDGVVVRSVPSGLRGVGDASAWILRISGMGLPIGIDPVLSAEETYPTYTTRFVGVATGERAPGASVASDEITSVALIQGYREGDGDFYALELSGATPSQRLELSSQMSALAPTKNGVVTLATASECGQTGADCSGYAPGVSVFDLSGEPRLVASLPFPQLPLPFIADPNRVSVRWELYDPLNERQPAALPLGDNQLAFVAEVYLSCDNPADCDALEVTAVPVAQANVAFGTPAPCPPSDVDPDCDDTPPPNPTVYGTGTRQYFYVLDVDAAGGPAFEAWGESRLAATAARTDRESRFGFPLATDGALAATRLERRRSATDLNDRGSTRFFLDRFERTASGEVVALPPVNVPGYPVARVGGDAAMERWFSVEALPGETGAGRLHRMNVQSDGARIEQSLDLGGRFAGFRVLASGEAQLGLVLSTPDDGCGTSQLWSIPLGSDLANASEPLAIGGALELPSDDWTIAATDGDLALLRRDLVHVLVRASADGTLSLVSTTAIDIAFGDEQLLGTRLFALGQGRRSVELGP